MSETEELLPGTRRALLHRLARGQADGRTPSLVGAVARGGEPVWSGGRSMIDGHAPDADTQYRIGSITKTFAAVLVMRLVAEGLVALDDTLETHLTADSVPGGLTIRQLLSHTAGLAAETPEPWWERTPGTLRPGVGEILPGSPVRHEPGSRFHYSNTGFALLGALVERVRGAAWGEVLRAEVLQPLGLTRTTLLPQAPHAGGFAVHPWADVMMPEPLTDTGVMAPAGQLWSTARDLCRWARFLTRGDERVLDAGVLADMRRPAGGPDEPWTTTYGLGLQLMRDRGRLMFGHGGSMPGFLAGVWVCEEEDVAAVVLTNVTSGVPVAGLAADLIAVVAEHEPRIPSPWRPLESAPDPELLALTGPWYWGAAPYALRLRAEQALELAPLGPLGRSARFRRRPDGSWTGLNNYYDGETLRIVRRPDGTVSHLDLGSFVLTREPYAPAEVIPGGVPEGGWLS